MSLLVDTHCHLTYDELAPRIDDVLARAASAGVTRCITVATDPDDAVRAIDLMSSRPALCLAAGIHPHGAAKADANQLGALSDLHHGRFGGVDSARLVAVGETGLDFHYDFAPHDTQERVFLRQLELACEVRRPVIIHAREAEARVCEILDEFEPLRGRVVFHCFSGDGVLARRVLDGGWWLSFTGVVTFRNADAIRSAARYAPADRIMVETDAPYLSPEPVRKVRPNEPAFVAHTARYLAQLRNTTAEAFAATTTSNAQRFFNLPESTT